MKREVVVVLAALATLPVVLLESRGFSPLWLVAADWLIWGVFAFSLMVGLRSASNRVTYLRRHPIDVAVVLLSFPLLPSLLALSRLVRIARLLRIALSAGRALPALRESLGRRELLYVTGVCTVLVVGAAVAIAVVEPTAVDDSIGTALWWALVTITTVGYGDVSPVGGPARVVAVILMIAGLGLISTLSASIAAFFVGQKQRSQHEAFESQVLAALARIEAREDQRARHQQSTGARNEHSSLPHEHEAS